MDTVLNNSTISPDAKIHGAFRIDYSTVDDECLIYKNVWLRNSTLAKKCLIADDSKIDNCKLSSFVNIARGCHLYHVNMRRHSYLGQNSVAMHCSVGAFCSLSWNVTLGSAEHDFNNLTTHSILYNPFHEMTDTPLYNRFSENCKLGSDVWIGAGAIILRGVSIGHGAVVGAGAVVTKDVEPYTIVIGSPAKPMRKRFDNKIINILLALQWWTLPDTVIRKHLEVFARRPDRATLEQLMELKEKYEEEQC